jgi:hypothetical protein
LISSSRARRCSLKPDLRLRVAQPVSTSMSMCRPLSRAAWLSTQPWRGVGGGSPTSSSSAYSSRCGEKEENVRRGPQHPGDATHVDSGSNPFDGGMTVASSPR